MCTSSKPAPAPITVPAPPPMPAQPAAAPQESDPAIQASRAKERKQRLVAADQNSTLVTGGQGLTSPATTAKKSAFGV